MTRPYVASRSGEPLHRRSFDVVVIGSGIAGLTAALQARTAGLRCWFRHQGQPVRGVHPLGPGRHRGGARPRDTPDSTTTTPWCAGAGVCDAEAVRSWSPRARRGARADRARARSSTPRGGRIADPRGRPPPRPDRARRRRRHRRRDPAPSLARARLGTPRIEVIEHALVVDLLPRDGAASARHAHLARGGQHDGRGHGRRCSPPAASARSPRAPPTRRSPPATGWRSRSGPAPRCATWSSCSSTRRCCTSARTRGQQPLISEAVRGEGAFLVDFDGEPLHAGRPRARPTSRRATSSPRRSPGGCSETGHRTCGSTPGTSAPSFWERRFPTILASCRRAASTRSTS